MDGEVFNDIYNWFFRRLEIIYLNTVIRSSFSIFNSNNSFSITRLLEYFDTGITDYILEESSIEEMKKYLPSEVFDAFYKDIKSSFMDIDRKDENIKIKGTLRSERHIFDLAYDNEGLTISKLLFKHGKNNNANFNFKEESDGTKRLIELLDVIYNDNEDKVFLIDELDRSLHPQMTRKFIETFFKIY